MVARQGATGTPSEYACTIATKWTLPVFPCKPTKAPYTAHGFKDATLNLVQIREWFARWPDALVAVPTGAASKLLVVDVDPDGAAWYHENADRLAPGRVHRTRRGHHLLYRMPEEPIGNSAGKLAPGVDVRAEGGYIIWWAAHGLEAAGDLADIAAPPGWLLEALKGADRPANPVNGTVIEGGRHDALKRMAAKLRRAGLKGAPLEKALLHWNDEHCSPPQDRDDVIRLAADFTPKAGADPETERPFVLVPVSELMKISAAPEYVVAGLIEKGSRVGFVAPPESAKSLFAQHLAATVATGRGFHHRQVQRGLAVYLFGEGQHGAARRFQALEAHYKLGLADAALVISKVATSLLDPLETLRVRDAIRAAEDRYSLPLTLLVVDTVARFIAPGDESKAQDMGAYIAAVDQLAGDAAAISCHHPGHGDSTRGRGSSSWKAALDTEYTMAATDTPTGRIVTVTCQKMKDGPKPEPFSFVLTTAPTLAEHPDGTAVQSVVLVPTDMQPMKSAPTGKNQKLLLAELELRIPRDGERVFHGIVNRDSRAR